MRIAVGVLIIIAGIAAYPWVWQEYRLQRARTLLSRRDLPAATDWLEAALRADPDRGEAHFLRARVARREGQMEQVREHLRQAWEAGYDRRRIEREQWLALAQTGQLAEAEPHLQQLLADPRGDAVEICEAYVNGYLLAYRFQDALQLIEAWEADFPEDPQPHYCRALVWEHLRRTADSVEQLRIVLRLDPTRLDARLLLADQLTALHRYEEAGQQYAVCLEQDPGNAEALLGYGFCLLEQGMVDQPRQWFQQVLDTSPGNVRARLGLGSVALMEGRNEEAAELLRPVVRLQPHNRDARYKLASALQALGKGDEAAEHFERVEAANQAMARVQILLEGLRTQPDQIAPRLEVGQLLLKYGSSAEGVAWLRSILEIEPRHEAAHRALAEHYESLAMPDLAARHWKMVAKDEQGRGS